MLNPPDTVKQTVASVAEDSQVVFLFLAEPFIGTVMHVKLCILRIADLAAVACPLELVRTMGLPFCGL